jgi:glycosyltransferase involved in cell wall biosynthesis
MALFAEELISEIIIVDNASSDGTAKYIDNIINTCDMSGDCGRVRVMHAYKNEGVIKPRNYGLHMATKKYAIILDDDQYITVGHTMKLYREALKQFDIVGYIPGLINPIVGAIVVEDGGPFNHVGEGGLAMSTNLWHDLDYFDTDFGKAYREGPDVQLRAIQLGKTIGLIKDARISHDGGRTLSRKDIGFNLKEEGDASHTLIMNRVNDGYYGKAYEVIGEVFE